MIHLFPKIELMILTMVHQPIIFHAKGLFVIDHVTFGKVPVRNMTLKSTG